MSRARYRVTRALGAALSLLGASAWVLTRFTGALPLRGWFLPHLLGVWACTALLAVACCLSGDGILEQLLGTRDIDGRPETPVPDAARWLLGVRAPGPRLDPGCGARLRHRAQRISLEAT